MRYMVSMEETAVSKILTVKMEKRGVIIGLFNRLTQGLSKTRDNINQKSRAI